MKSLSRPLIYSLLLLSAAIAAAADERSERRLLGERTFELAKDGRQRVVLELEEPGVLILSAAVREPTPTTPLRLLLEGPDGLTVEKQGSAPLRMRYRIDRPALGNGWTASVHNVSKLGLVTGRFRVELLRARLPDAAPSTPEASEAASRRSPGPVTDGKITHADPDRIRAVCRDRNRDVFVRLDMERGTGGLFLKYRQVAALDAGFESETVIRLSGSGEQPLFLDTKKEWLYFRDDPEEIFCRVQIYYGAAGSG